MILLLVTLYFVVTEEFTTLQITTPPPPIFATIPQFSQLERKNIQHLENIRICANEFKIKHMYMFSNY